MEMNVILIVLLPFFGTILGSGAVFLLRGKMNRSLQRGLTGFASGVMVAASVWSLIIPAMEQSQHMGKLAFLPSLIGVWTGFGFLLLLDHLIPHLHLNSHKPEGVPSKLGRSAMMMLAVTLHNFPEGMAVGVVAAGWLTGNESISFVGALALALGIALQNLPEGAIISMPLKSLWIRRSFRCCGTHRRHCHDFTCRSTGTRPSLFARLFRRRNALCCGGGIDSGDVGRRTFQHRTHFLCGGIYADDGFGRCFGINI